ncbi:MAG: hypothetical protein AABY22_16385, partial [Nanoarchaeota archaeon]
FIQYIKKIQNSMNNVVSQMTINKMQEQILLGSLLGDGSIHNKNGYLRYFESTALSRKIIYFGKIHF